MRHSYGSIVCALALIASASIAVHAAAQQQADPDADLSVENPAHVDHHPRVAIDAAHRNFHTMDGRYAPFAKLMQADGCKVVANTKPFSAETLAEFDVVVIANAGADDDRQPIFTESEIEALDGWVRSGGALFLIADHAPYGRLAKDLAARFGVEMRNCYTLDAEHATDTRSASHIAYSHENGLLADHAITRGRNDEERVNRVVTFTGQSLGVPGHATALLRLGDRAVDRIYGLRDGQPVVTDTVSADGRAQLLAFEHGKGRVVVSAEAAMFTAQIVPRDDPKNPFRMGFNRPGSDNRQFALNVMRWLAGVLEPEDDSSSPAD